MAGWLEEALRYLGVRGEADPALTDELVRLSQRLDRPKYLYRVFPISQSREGVVLEGAGLTLPGTLAGTMLAHCHRAVLLLCTLGAGFETLMRATQARDMARAVMLDALGSAWVEGGCDQAQEEIAARWPDSYLTDRFSPGYGDLPLTLQREVCGLLDGPRRLGVTVTDSFLLNPAKSVTAILGLSHRPQPARIRGCDHCLRKDTCHYRREGTTCVS